MRPACVAHLVRMFFACLLMFFAGALLGLNDACGRAAAACAWLSSFAGSHTSWGHLPSLPLINKRAGAVQGSVRDAADPHFCTPIRPTTDVLARYKTMHETLVYLSHLDHDDTEHQMLDKLRLQVGLC